ncbi:hypothetical protein EFB08_09405 [Rufibacter latericius]|uniref:Uncharacterized protein n=1 Tax=Rufibacter latericius TaxID=2487040 RepID=A0A3M9MV85_9BACT|nr:hypothetical protein EFB08_09405 [Rufibacter latericius]
MFSPLIYGRFSENASKTQSRFGKGKAAAGLCNRNGLAGKPANPFWSFVKKLEPETIFPEPPQN